MAQRPFVLFSPKVTGRGTYLAPVTGLLGDECLRQAEQDYELTNDVGKAWIRRCLMAEEFARSLEVELERLRKCPARDTSSESV